ncbi:MAG: DUF1934 domain-containing protein [Bacteroidaceae bacterium]|nr:DUF1934 domain-containing protein [Bacteroidaceae bacterium]
MLFPITLTSRLNTRTPDGTFDTIEQTHHGMAALRDNGTWSLRYADADNNGQTALQGATNWMSISREGDTQSRMLFRLDEMLEAVYRTPQGEFEMSTRATTYTAQVDAQGGAVVLHYDLYVSGELVAHNQLLLQWQRREEQ